LGRPPSTKQPLDADGSVFILLHEMLTTGKEMSGPGEILSPKQRFKAVSLGFIYSSVSSCFMNTGEIFQSVV